MNLKNIIRIGQIMTATVTLVFTGCTDLEEDVLDEKLFGDGSITVESTLAAAYDRLGDGLFVDNGGMLSMQEYTTDVALLPTRGSDWGDGGKWRALHEFTWTSSSPVITDNWNRLTNGITRSLTAIRTITNSSDPNKTMFLAEAKGLLAFYSYYTLDLFDQVPYRDPLIVDPITQTASAPLEITLGADAIDALITDVEALIPDLPGLTDPDAHAHTGRFTKEAAYALLADMYLNRAVYKDRYNLNSNFNFKETAVNGTDNDMDRVIYYTSLLINSGTFQLESNYFDNFAIGNSGASEHIFAVVQKIDGIRDGDNDLGYVCQARNQRPSPKNRGTNASCTTPEFFASWDGNHDDLRFSRKHQYGDGTWFMNDGTDVSVPATDKVAGSNVPWFHFNRGILYGQQYGPKLSDNAFVMTEDGRIAVFQLFMEKSSDTPMDFTPELTFDNPLEAVFKQNQINQGARIFKFEFDPAGVGSSPDNGKSGVDIPLYRLGGIYTMRAEAYFRNGQPDLALADINMLRTQRTRELLYGNAPGTPLPSLTITSLYKELGYELYWEMHRRPQMIRFGEFDKAYTAKQQSEVYRRVFPIPQETIDVTKEFSQNFGYDL